MRAAVCSTAELDDRLQQRAKLVVGEARILDDTAHREGVDGIVPRDSDDPYAIAHDDMLALPDYPETGLLESAHGILVIDAW